MNKWLYFSLSRRIFEKDCYKSQYGESRCLTWSVLIRSLLGIVPVNSRWNRISFVTIYIDTHCCHKYLKISKYLLSVYLFPSIRKSYLKYLVLIKRTQPMIMRLSYLFGNKSLDHGFPSFFYRSIIQVHPKYILRGRGGNNFFSQLIESKKASWWNFLMKLFDETSW